MFGLHPNAEIGYYTKSARDMWEQLIELQPQSGMLKETMTDRRVHNEIL